MRSYKRQPSEVNPETERLAGRIAAAIINQQRAIAAKVNAFINRYPRSIQKKFLFLFCLCWLAAICCSICLLRNGQEITPTQKNFQPVHIGQAFDLPKPPIKLIKPTDSLTIKK